MKGKPGQGSKFSPEDVLVALTKNRDRGCVLVALTKNRDRGCEVTTPRELTISKRKRCMFDTLEEENLMRSWGILHQIESDMSEMFPETICAYEG